MCVLCIWNCKLHILLNVGEYLMTALFTVLYKLNNEASFEKQLCNV